MKPEVSASPRMDIRPVAVRRLGVVPYARASEYQKDLVRKVCEDARFPEHLLLLEHPPVFTIGRSSRQNNIVADADLLRREGIEVQFTARGGDITYHGPGQLVAYPILRLDQRGRSIHRYLRSLEGVVIDLLAAYNITGATDPHYTGVWARGAKICALGVAVTRWVTWHGLALNVNTNLRHFELIVPCGIHGKTVTSLKKELGRTVDMEEAADRLERSFEKVFHCRLERPTTEADAD